MAQPIENQLSEDDYHLLNANRLGTPLAVYKMKPIVIHVLCAIGLFALVLGIGELTFILATIPLGWHNAHVDGYVFMYIGLSIASLCAGVFVLGIELPRVQKHRIIVCEQGLFQMKEKHRSRKIEVMYWRDILAIRRLYDGYYITQRGGEPVTLDILYQNVKELVTVIKTRSGIV